MRWWIFKEEQVDLGIPDTCVKQRRLTADIVQVDSRRYKRAKRRQAKWYSQKYARSAG